MTTIAHSEPALTVSARPFRLALLLLFGAAFSIGTLEFASRHTHTMTSHTLSELFYAPGGFALFPAGAVLLGGALLVWAHALARDKMRSAAALAALGALAIVVSAVFPTDPSGTLVLSWSAQVHRYAAAIMFIAVPVTGLVQLRTSQSNPASRSMISTSVGLSALAALPAIGGRLDALVPPGGWQNLLDIFAAACGLVERFQLLLVITIIATSTHALTVANEVRKTASLAVHKQQ